MNHAFNSLPLTQAMLANLDSLAYTQMTPIQAEALPAILEGRDLLAQARTGSGKTAAFGIGLLQGLNPRFFGVQALVLCPTRELADQVSKELRRLARATQNIKLVTLVGGLPMGPQADSLYHGAHIVVGTPGRVLKHLNRGKLDLSQLATLVLDEADRMLDMGFSEELDAIIERLPSKRQTLLFSATYPDSIAELSAHVLSNPVEIRIESTHKLEHIEQHFYEVEESQRLQALISLLIQYTPQTAIIFCNTRARTQELADRLDRLGYSVAALHGDLEQRQRDQVLAQFANRSRNILVATDVAARGIDIKELDAVFNYELSFEPEVHIHRIGRSGRAGREGLAISLYSAKEVHRLKALQALMGETLQPEQAEIIDDVESRLDSLDLSAPMVTLQIDGGRRQKLRAGDILGALTCKGGIEGRQVGKIDLFDTMAYVAVESGAGKQALKLLSQNRIKNRSFRVRLLP